MWALRLDRSARAAASRALQLSRRPARIPGRFVHPQCRRAVAAASPRRNATVPSSPRNPYTQMQLHHYETTADLMNVENHRGPQRQSRLLGHPRPRHRERLPRQGRPRLRLRLRAQRAEPVVALQADGRRRPVVRQPRARAREPAVDRLPGRPLPALPGERRRPRQPRLGRVRLRDVDDRAAAHRGLRHPLPVPRRSSSA